MRAIVVTRAGGPEVLELQDVPDPQPDSGRLVVDVEAVGVNYRDVYEREGRYQTQPPLIAGVEGAGTCDGERVAWSDAPGSYAERVAVDPERLGPVPEGVSSEQAAAVPLPGKTAHYPASDTYP